MARGRLVSRTLGSSRKFAALRTRAGKLGEFAQALYPLLIACSDDFGRMAGDAFTVKLTVFPSSPRSEKEFADVLDALEDVGLIQRYESKGRRALQVIEFDRHQPGLHRRTDSEFAIPAAAGPLSSLSASERQIEDFIAAELRAGRLSLSDHRIVTVEQQVRIQQFYLDIVAKTDAGVTVVVEVKRQRVTSGALDQVRGYAALISGAVETVAIGHGLAAGLDVAVTDVLIGTYDDRLQCSPVNAAACSRTFTHVPEIPSEKKRTEEKGIEENRTALLRVDDRFADFWTAYPKKKSKGDAEKAWRKLAPSVELSQRILAAIAAQRQTHAWQKDGGQFIPYPASWLNAKRWEDEPDRPAAAAMGSRTLALVNATAGFLAGGKS